MVFRRLQSLFLALQAQVILSADTQERMLLESDPPPIERRNGRQPPTPYDYYGHQSKEYLRPAKAAYKSKRGTTSENITRNNRSVPEVTPLLKHAKKGAGEHESMDEPVHMKSPPLVNVTVSADLPTVNESMGAEPGEVVTEEEEDEQESTPNSTRPGNSSSPRAKKAVRRPPVLVLPQNFSRIEAAHAWGVSPFVSQTRLDELWKHLFDQYEKAEPPVPSSGGPLAVGVGINVVKFKGFDEVSGTISLAINLRLCWEDSRLLFHSHDFFGRWFRHQGDKIPLRSDLLWKPDIMIMNGIGSERTFTEDHSPLALADRDFADRTGVNVLWSRPLNIDAKCDIDFGQYPFDIQYCKILIAPWASSRRYMRLVPQPFYQDTEVHSSEFRIGNLTYELHDVYTHGYAETFSEVHYSFILERFPHYYVVNFIIPMVAITMLTIATMWMGQSQLNNLGQRVNSATKLLLCVVSITFITARNRPAIHGDIWLDRFQSHCLALSMSAVLQSLFVENYARLNIGYWAPKVSTVDAGCRTFILGVATWVLLNDAIEVKRAPALALYTSFKAESTRLLVAFVYVIWGGLGVSTFWALFSCAHRVVTRKREGSMSTLDWQQLPMSDMEVEKKN